MSESLGITTKPRVETEVGLLTPKDIVGAYTGISGPPVVVRNQGELLVCEISARTRLQVPLIQVQGGWQAEVGGASMALGFFRCSEGEPALMLGSVAYRRMST